MESWRRSRDDDSTSTTSTSTTTIASDTWRGIGPSGATTGYKWGTLSIKFHLNGLLKCIYLMQQDRRAGEMKSQLWVIIIVKTDRSTQVMYPKEVQRDQEASRPRQVLLLVNLCTRGMTKRNCRNGNNVKLIIIETEILSTPNTLSGLQKNQSRVAVVSILQAHFMVP